MLERSLVPRHRLGDLGTHGLDTHDRVRRIARCVDRRHDHGGGAIARHIAVVETERCGDHARTEVVVHRERGLVDRVGIERGVLARVERNPAERLAGGAVTLHVQRGVHRDPVRGRRRAIRQPPLHIALDAPAAAVLSAAALQFCIGGLPDGAEAQHVTAQARGHGQHRVDDRTGLTGCLWPAAVPRGAQSQRILDGGDATLTVAVPTAGAGVRGQAIDIFGCQPGIGDRPQTGLHRQRHGVAHQAAAKLRHADTRDGHLVFELVLRRHRAGDPPPGVVVGDRPWCGVSGGGEHRQPDVVMLLELHLHAQSRRH
ncbi:unannotated protein [freshwater metagenome]|uniref:Unannotated protein n=1 Tax=freshwater metagenome TaxID=449393 RepID=A0A6J7QWV3_9ZZZZ